MNLRIFGAGALALAMLLVTLTTWPVSAKECGRLERSRGAVAKIECPSEGRAVQRDRRHFRAGREARRHGGAHGAAVRAGDGGMAPQADNDGRLVLAATEPLRLARPAGAPVSGIHGLVSAAAAAAGVPERIAHAVISIESGYRPHLRGAAGEWGLGQIKCQTASSVGYAGPCSGLADPATNLRYSMAYLAGALRKGGTGCAGVSLYQRGIFGRAACTGYGRRVMARAGS